MDTSTWDSGVELSTLTLDLDTGMMTVPRTMEWGHMEEFCTCKSPPGYLSLRDPHNTFVCGACLKPSLLVWLGSERFCEECGCSIYTRWELICSPCQTDVLALVADLAAQGIPPQDRPESAQWCHRGAWVGWPTAREKSKETWPWRWKAA